MKIKIYFNDKPLFLTDTIDDELEPYKHHDDAVYVDEFSPPAINSVILSSLPKPQHGLMAGLIIIFSALGGSFGSVITGHVFEAYGGQKAFFLSIIPIALLLLALILFYILQRKSAVKQQASVPIITDPISEEFRK